MNLDYVCKSLGYKITTQKADWNYNIGHNRAEEIWNKYKDYYNQFDVIITSDTVALARIFLQNNYEGKLIIWCSNRFNYSDEATNDCNFPEEEFYELMRSAKHRKNVKVFSYTKFEYEFAAQYKNVDLGTDMIKPCAFIEENHAGTAFPDNIVKSDTFFIPNYHNETNFMNLKEKCDQLGIPSYGGRYNGPSDLEGVKGIIAIPYAWQNLALWENWSLGNVYFIPSQKYFVKMTTQDNFWFQNVWAIHLIASSEWYLPAHKDLFMYFDSWDHLKKLTQNTALLEDKKKKVLAFSKNHSEQTLKKWSEALTKW